MSLTVSSPDWFKLDGVLCDTMGLYCDTPQIPPMAKKRFTTFKFGSDEDGVYSDDSFENVKYTLTAFKFPMSKSANFYDTALFAWIQSAKKLELSRYSGYYFKIRTIDGIQPVTRSDGMRIDYKISMTLSPFRYHTSNDEFALPNDGVITNTGTRYSKPIIKFAMTPQDATITTNGVPLVISQAASATVTIDSNRMLIYKTVDNENISIMEHTEGKLPLFSVGTNLVTVSSNVSNVTVIGNWRCY